MTVWRLGGEIVTTGLCRTAGIVYDICAQWYIDGSQICLSVYVYISFVCVCLGLAFLPPALRATHSAGISVTQGGDFEVFRLAPQRQQIASSWVKFGVEESTEAIFHPNRRRGDV